MKDENFRKELEEDGIRFLGYSRYDRLEDYDDILLQTIPGKTSRRNVSHLRKCVKANRKLGSRGK